MMTLLLKKEGELEPSAFLDLPFWIKQEDARRRLRGMCGFKKELRVCWMEMEVE